jgi:hypothetical protein
VASTPGGISERAFKAAVIQRDLGQCWICGHFGAKTVDHLVPQTDGGDVWDMGNVKAAHGSGRKPNGCLVCSAAMKRPVYCQTLRGAYSVERARRIIAERIILAGGVPDIPGFRPAGSVKRSPGRPW